MKLGSGAFGVVTSNRDNTSCTKESDLFSTWGSIVPNNLAEAVFHATEFGMEFRNCIRGTVRLRRSRKLLISMPRGADLHQYDDHPMSTEAVKRLFDDIVKGLHELHSAGLVHGDVKPGNIVVAGNPARAHLIDYGSIRLFEGLSSGSSDQRPGTLTFCAPECLRGCRPSPACDAYSLGATLYYMLNRAYIIPHCNDLDEISALAYLDKAGELELRAEHHRGDPELRSVLAGLLKHDPAERTTVASLYYKSNDVVIDPDRVTLEPCSVADWPDRAAALETHMFGDGADLPRHCVGLAVSLVDRYAGRMGRPLDDQEIKHCGIIACAFLDPECTASSRPVDRGVVARILDRLDFKIYTETCDSLLKKERGHPSVDHATLCDALKAGRTTRDALAAYEARRAYVRIDC